MPLHRICERDVDVARPSETVVALATRLHQRNVGCLVVVDEDRRPIGVITDRDLVIRVLARGLDPSRTQAEEIMSTELATIDIGASNDGVLEVMRANGVRRLPVVGEDGRLAGVVSIDDILVCHADQMVAVGSVLEGEGPRRLAQG
ncbi:MAG: CBS domain-containing protein [Planctomycetes bacterium]|nr:CBS domain-containing protein [Planctomycetota bacterium]